MPAGPPDGRGSPRSTGERRGEDEFEAPLRRLPGWGGGGQRRHPLPCRPVPPVCPRVPPPRPSECLSELRAALPAPLSRRCAPLLRPAAGAPPSASHAPRRVVKEVPLRPPTRGPSPCRRPRGSARLASPAAEPRRGGTAARRRPSGRGERRTGSPPVRRDGEGALPSPPPRL